jgi:hypothetical protein
LLQNYSPFSEYNCWAVAFGGLVKTTAFRLFLIIKAVIECRALLNESKKCN